MSVKLGPHENLIYVIGFLSIVHVMFINSFLLSIFKRAIVVPELFYKSRLKIIFFKCLTEVFLLAMKSIRFIDNVYFDVSFWTMKFI